MERQGGEDGADTNTARIEEAKRFFFSRATRGDLFELQTLVNSIPEENGERAELINSLGFREKTILHIAVDNGHLPLVEWILSESGGRAAGFNKILAKDSLHETALHIAAGRGQLQVFLAIVDGCKVENGERVAMLNAVTDVGGTVLHQAAICRNIPIIEWILSDSGGRAAGFNSVLPKSIGGRSVLHSAVTTGHETFLAILEGLKVENGERAAVLNAVDGDGETVLHLASILGDEGTVKWLLSEKGREAGFNSNNIFHLTKENKSVLHVAVNFSNVAVDCFDLILGRCSNAEERSRLLFGVDSEGWTVLHYAAKNGRLPVLEWVISHLERERGGSNEYLFPLTDDKKSILHFAARGGSAECFELVLSHCHNTSERLRLFLGRDNEGWTIFHHAARFNEGEIISHILRKYPEESKMIINARDNRGMTVLHRTIIEGLDEESRREWGFWRNHEDRKCPVIAALLGFEESNNSSGVRTATRNLAAMKDDGEEEKPIDVKRVIAAAGADPNLGLNFE